MIPLPSIVAAAQQGDKEAFDQLVIRFQDMAYASAYAILGDPHLAQDAAQDAFLDAYQNLAHLREPAAFPGWFRRIVFGRSHRQIRAKAPAVVSLDDLFEIDGYSGSGYAGNGYRESGFSDPVEVVNQIDVAQQVQEAIAALSPNLRMAIALYYIEGYSQKEIAAYLETPVSTVKKRLFDARQQLKERMIQMMQVQMQVNRPSQNDDFARKVQFFTAILAGDLTQIEQLLRQDSSLLSATVEWKMALKSGYWPLGSNALHLAVARDDRAAVELLLSHDAAVDARNTGEMTPLHLAAIMQRSQMARLLLEQGADVDARSRASQTPLHHAALRGDVATMQTLLEYHADVTALDREQHTPADLAAVRGDQSSVDLLIAHGAMQPTLSAPPIRTPYASDSPVLVTGIKTIDLLAPLPRGGIAGHFTPLSGVGFSVVLAQFITSLRELHDGYAVYLGLETFNGYAESLPISWQELGINDRVSYLFGAIEDSTDERMKLLERSFAAAQAHCQAGHETLLLVDSNLGCSPGVLPYLRANLGAVRHPSAAITVIVHGHHTVGVLPAALADLTTLTTFNGALARQRLYPAIDPLHSGSQLFEQQLAGSKHAQTATEARRLLQRYMDLHPVVESGGVEALWYIDDDPLVQQTVIRARRLQRFLAQPFYGAEPWTGLMGQLVPLEETLKGCQAILRGEYDALPEEAFYFVGTIEEVMAKASTLKPLA